MRRRALTQPNRRTTEVNQAGIAMRFDELVKMLRSILLAATAARGHAIMKKDKAGEVRVKERVSRLESAMSEARVQSRTRAAEEPIPDEVTTPVVPAADDDGKEAEEARKPAG